MGEHSLGAALHSRKSSRQLVWPYGTPGLPPTPKKSFQVVHSKGGNLETIVTTRRTPTGNTRAALRSCPAHGFFPSWDASESEHPRATTPWTECLSRARTR